MKKHHFISLACHFLLFTAMAGEKPGWNFNAPFEQKVFVENKGQYEEKLNAGKGRILFSTLQDGYTICWSKTGLSYRVTERYLSEEAKREIEKEGHPEEALEKMQKKYHFLHMQWVGCNPNAEVVKEDEVSHYYTFKDPSDKSGHSGIKAQAYKKITYRNIYPGIDVVYTLPENGGVKYSFVLHPGADISLVKIKYDGSKSVRLNASGGVEIDTKYCGNFLEHAPQSFYDDGTPVASVFTLQNNVIGFEAPGYDKTRELTIDPWVSVVNFPNTNPSYAAYATHGYDVAYDNAGNVWVYGGGDPLHVGKYSNTGVLLWIFQVPLTADLVGDFDVNKISGTAYVCEGYNGNGAGVVKISTAGIQQAQFAGTTQNYEMSRIRFDCAGAKLFTTGGGVPAGVWQVCGLDTNLTGYTGGAHTTSSPNGDHDVNLMTLDPAGGFMYLNFNYPAPFSADYLNDNEMQKVPVPGFTPVTWIQPGPIYGFIELGSIPYAGPYAGTTYDRINMFNGMVCSPGFLYTYDGTTIKKWNKSTGTLITSVSTGGTTYASGGLDVDLCENVYAGVGNQIKVYDANLNPVTSYGASNTIYDLKVDNNTNQVYATGNGFVSAITIPPLTFTLTTTSSSACGACNGTASASMTNTNVNCNATINYSYLWLPGGQTTQSVTGLCSGTYTVIVDATLACAKGTSDTGYVTISNGTPITVTSSTICAGQQTATLTASGATSYTWSPGTGLSGTTGSVVTANPGATTVYTITANGNCVNTSTVTVNAPPTVTANSGTICLGQQTATLTANGAVSYTWSPATGLSGTNGTSVTANPSATQNYTVAGTDANGCVNTGTLSVLVNPLPVVTSTSASVCPGATGTLTASGANTYTWNTGTTGATLTQTPGSTTSYTVVGTNANGCFSSGVGNITVFPTPTVSANNATICLGQQTATLTASGASTYSWSPPTGLSSTSETSVSANPNTNTTYTIVGTIGTCTASTTCVVTVNPLPTPVAGSNSPLCVNQTLNLTSSGGTIYSWNGPNSFSSALQSPSIAGITMNGAGVYTVTVTDANTCYNTATVSVTVNPLPVVPVTGATVCAGQTIQITSGGGTTYSWMGPLGFTSSQQNPSIANATTAMSGSYVVTVTDNNTCTNANIAQVLVNPLPVVTVNSSTICLGASANLTANGASTYSWNPATGLNTSTGASVIASPNTTITYTVSGTSAAGCAGSDTAQVFVNPLPGLAPGPSAAGCTPVCVNFVNSSTVTGTCSWNFGDGATSTSCSPSHCFSGLGVFKTRLTLTDANGCTNTDSVSVTVYPQPVADFAYGPVPASSLDPIYFTDLSQGAVGPNSYGPYGVQWYLGDVFLPNNPANYVNNTLSPTHIYGGSEMPYTYYVTQWVMNQYGCKDSITKPIEVIPPWTFYIPNAFSPNGDGVNEGFKGIGMGIDNTTYNLWVFDRWGMMIFYTNDMEKVWDGRIQGHGNGDIVQEDVYVWKVKFHDFTGRSHEYHGTVSVVK